MESLIPIKNKSLINLESQTPILGVTRMDIMSENNHLDLDMYPRPPSQKDIAEQI